MKNKATANHVKILTERTPRLLLGFGTMSAGVFMEPNEKSSATRPAGRHDCNQSAMAGFAAAHG